MCKWYLTPIPIITIIICATFPSTVFASNQYKSLNTIIKPIETNNKNQQHKIMTSIVTDASDAYPTYPNNQRKIVRDSMGNIYVTYANKNSAKLIAVVAKSSDNGMTWSELPPPLDTDYQGSSSIAIDSNNNLHLVWVYVGLGWTREVWYSKYNTTWSTPIMIGSNDSANPSIAIDSKDNVHIVWNKNEKIMHISYLQHNSSWSPITQLSNNTHPHANSPSIAIDSFDNVHVVWSYGGHILYCKKENDTWSNLTYVSSSSWNTGQPSIAIDSNNTIHVVWYAVINYTNNYSWQIYYNKCSKDKWSSQIKLSTTTENSTAPSIGITENNRIYVLWTTGVANLSCANIKMRVYNNSWDSEENLTNEIADVYPNVRWSFYNNPPNTNSDEIDYVYSKYEYHPLRTLIIYSSNIIPIHEYQNIPIIILFTMVMMIAIFLPILKRRLHV